MNNTCKRDIAVKREKESQKWQYKEKIRLYLKSIRKIEEKK